jgi:subtilisin family serine protease
VWRELAVRGQGIVVGQSDSGVQFDHPELRDSYRGSAGNHDGNWLDPWYGSQAPYDASGHGTHTLGSVLGNTVGVAPDATWIACATLYRNLGNPALYLDCLQFMLAPYPQQGDPFADGDPTRSANVLNNSWGCPEEFEGCDPTSLQPAVAALRAAGVFVVASAGNSGPACGTVTDPIALYDESFTVGAVDRSGDLALFSSRGPVSVDGSGRVKPDIVAPGVDVLSAFPGGTYATQDGTSMAGPHVAGVVALLWSANPDLVGDIERTEQILIDSARPFTGTVNALPGGLGDGPALPGGDGAATQCGATGLGVTPNNFAGYGRLDAYRAVQLALQGQQTTP